MRCPTDQDNLGQPRHRLLPVASIIVTVSIPDSPPSLRLHFRPPNPRCLLFLLLPLRNPAPTHPSTSDCQDNIEATKSPKSGDMLPLDTVSISFTDSTVSLNCMQDVFFICNQGHYRVLEGGCFHSLSTIRWCSFIGSMKLLLSETFHFWIFLLQHSVLLVAVHVEMSGFLVCSFAHFCKAVTHVPTAGHNTQPHHVVGSQRAAS